MLLAELEGIKKENKSLLDENVKLMQKQKELLEDKESKRKSKKESKKKKRESSSSEEQTKKPKKVTKMDPEKMTIQEIKSALTHAGKDYVLPTDKRPKSDYVKLFNKHMKE